MKEYGLRYIAALLAALSVGLGALALNSPASAPAPPASPVPVSGEEDAEEEDEEIAEDGVSVDEDDQMVRENPVIEYDDEIDIPIPGFIPVHRNKINLNGADWTSLRKQIAKTKSENFVIVHIGDSHVQADINTGTTRDLLQYDFGDGGRGIITPLKMSGTNEPRDYIFSSSRSWNAQKLMRHPWRRTMGFTGTSITPATGESDITIGTSSRDDYDPFHSFLLFHRGKLTISSVSDEEGSNVDFQTIPSRDYTQVILKRPVSQATVRFDSEGDLTLFGAYLSGDRPGVVYNSIGNNGATYATYNSIGAIGQGIAPLSPDLVIISLGTNEAFGRLDTQSFRRNIDKLVSDIRSSCPQSQILLVTPMECQRSVYTTKTSYVKVPAGSGRSRKGKRGKKRRRRSSRRTTTKKVSRKVRSYGVNTNILPLRNEILRYGADNNIAVYDWYDVAGGQGASSTWINNGYFSGDRVHHSAKGYHLQGRLLYEALLDEFGRNPSTK